MGINCSCSDYEYTNDLKKTSDFNLNIINYVKNHRTHHDMPNLDFEKENK